MPHLSIDAVDLYYELHGGGDPLVLVHGSWTDHTSWNAVVAGFAESHTVLTYDRRGHSRSTRLDAQGSRRRDEDDLAALIEQVALAPAHVVGTSYGGSIALGLSARLPELVRTVVAHEPPLLGAAAPGTQLHLTVAAIDEVAAGVVDLLRRGNSERAARRFVEDVALGPGAWELLPPASREVLVANAPMFLDLVGDPHWADVPAVAPRVPTMLTDGDASPPWFPGIVAALGDMWPDVARHTFRGAGHAPHLTHPDEHVRVARTFIGRSRTAAIAI
jgi:pimeloyl-ACP methyl ester carboxylesterase